MPHGRELGLVPSDIPLHGDPAPFPKKGADPRLSAHVYCGQTAGWIKMALDMDVRLGPGHIVLFSSPPKEGGTAPIFGPCLLWPNSCVDEDETWHGGRLRC